MKIKKEKMSNEFTKFHIRIDEKGEPLFNTVLHRFTNTDKGGPHDHPWGFTTHILKGGYVEKVYTIHEDGKWTSELIHRKPGTSHKVAANCIHEIVELPEGECWTLIMPGAPERQSGFWRFEGDFIGFRLWNRRKYRPVINAPISTAV